MARFYLVLSFFLTSIRAQAQITYFHQNFLGKGPFISENPNSEQFSHIIETADKLSFHEFGEGYLDLVRSIQDSATGGIIRVLRATPFVPNPTTIFIKLKFSVEEMQSISSNALYFYMGENFRSNNNSFPSNSLMFGRFSIGFQDSVFVIKDLQTQKTSQPLTTKTPVSITWVMNNSEIEQTYKLNKTSTSDYRIAHSNYDIWIDDQIFLKDVSGYPGGSPFSSTKLSNFEIRFRNGIGRVRLYELLMTDIPQSFLNENPDLIFAYPNPSPKQQISLRGARINPGTIKLLDNSGRNISIAVNAESAEQVQIFPTQLVSSGIYTVSYEQNKVAKTLRVMLD